MFKHYLTTALRHFRQHKLTTSINIVCLTIGLVCFLAIYATVTYMSRADQHFPNADRVYLIATKANSVPFNPMGPWLTAKYLKTDIPEIKTVARATFDVGMFNDIPVATKDLKTFVTAAYADPEFLHVFALPFEAGDGRESLRAPYSAVISHDTALRIFGSAQGAIDQPLRLQNGKEVRVRGVLGTIRQPSHIKTTHSVSFASVRFDVLLSMDVFEHSALADETRAALLTNWSVPFFLTYVELPEDGSFTANDLRLRLKSFGKRHADSASDVYQFDVWSLSSYKVNMFSGYTGSEKTGISATLMFYFLGALVLLISCFNYANLATAQAATRAKEIGMRRVVGASRRQIIVQFVFEAALMASAAFLCAFGLTTIAIFALDVSGLIDVVRSTLSTYGFWLTAVGLLAGVTATAGIYPAFVLSNVRPIHAVRAGKVRSGGRIVPRILVGMQFLGTSFLLISMLVMTNQNAKLKETVLSGVASTMVVGASTVRDANIDYEVFRTELMRQPHVQAVTAAQFSPWSLPAMPAYVARSSDPAENKLPTTQSVVNHDFFGTMGIRLLAGREFERGRAEDEIKFPFQASDGGTRSVVVDRAFAEQNGWLQPSDAIGKAVYATQYGSASNFPVPFTVIGVVENRPMGIVSPIGATSNIYVLSTVAAAFPIIRIATSDGAVALKEIESVWNKLAPSVAFKMQFADEQLNASYQTMNDVTNIFVAVASLALFISVLGLIGMSIQIIGRRLHEIGVRKTLGASVRNIVHLLVTDFSKPVIVANLLSWPLAFMTMRLYLSMFVNQAGLSFAPFIASLGLTVLTAWIAVAAQATRAARLNPASVLRTE